MSSTHDDDTCPHLVRASLFEAKIARLKAEVDRLEHQVNYWRIEAVGDNARWLRCLKDLEAVRKAGDAMLLFIENKTSSRVYAMIAKEWKEAKEGKPSV